MSYVNLSQHLQQLEAKGHIDIALSKLIEQVAQTCSRIDQQLQHGALAGILGSAGQNNVQGETQKKLDIISNDLLIGDLAQCGYVAALASEELDDKTDATSGAPYLILFDPLDGSSNIDINMAVGTIFSVLCAPAQPSVNTADFFQAGTQQVAAGYILYGPSTMLALTVGHGTDLFTFDPIDQQFKLTHPQLTIPTETNEFAINSSNARHWEPPVQQYINELIAGKSGPRQQDFNMRWVGCMVGDVHRILIRGGVFLYPYDLKDPKKAGRLRLMYEANPMSWLIEQAGGASTTGRQRILDVKPTDLHQRIPVILGSKSEVERIVSYHTNA